MKKRHCFKKSTQSHTFSAFGPKNLDLNLTFQVVGGVGGGEGGAEVVEQGLCCRGCLGVFEVVLRM